MIETVIFDLDGTLYEDLRVYERYVEELGRTLPKDARETLYAEWGAAKRREGLVLVGLGYDVEGDRLFRHERGQMRMVLGWEGDETPIDAETRFGRGHVNIGDWWRIPEVLAAHRGVPQEERQRAFLATRDHMHGLDLTLEPGMAEVLSDLRTAGKRLIAMSNSPQDSVDAVLSGLGILACFDNVIGDADKPHGLRDYLAATPSPEVVLSIGDNYINDIEPALEGGAYGLYIDRHETGFGAANPRCINVPNVPAAIRWIHTALQRSAM